MAGSLRPDDKIVEMAARKRLRRGCARALRGMPLLLTLSTVQGQQYVMSTIAGGAPPVMPGRGAYIPVVLKVGNEQEKLAGSLAMQ